MLKTGMQRLTEDLERTRPRSRSSSVDNDEPIELAHFPGAKVPDKDAVPPIDREDFPAPPYPYAVEELKRRLSSSSVENDDEEEEEEAVVSVQQANKAEKVMNRAQKVLDDIEQHSSIAHVIKQKLVEDSERKQRLGTDQRLHWDPRNASRTPSAKKMPHLKFRYDTPINASPSRHMNRPKPWVFWKSGEPDRAATTMIPCWHLPLSRMGTMAEERAATMPDGYGYYRVGADMTISSHYSDHSLDLSTSFGAVPPGNIRSVLRTSLPDMSRPVKTYPLEQLQTSNKFEMTPIEFYKLPEWKRINLKRKLKLF
ncbi:hypothetical protein niasHT_003213 [Heterodera trifolii]|uniref:HP domain-containing protein n=1 Tax=Heterodera trifolii TaxID=157864 RepID=A0ABD2LQD4_9BILA